MMLKPILTLMAMMLVAIMPFAGLAANASPDDNELNGGGDLRFVISPEPALKAIGPDAEDPISALIGLLKGEDKRLSASAAEALAQIGVDAVPELIDALGSEMPDVHRWAAYALNKIGPPAKEAVPALIATLDDKNSEVQWQVIEALGNIGPDAKNAVPKLIPTLDNENPNTRYYVIHALGSIGKGAEEAIPALFNLMKNHKPYDAGSLGETLGKIDGPAIPLLIGALKDENQFTRGEAVNGLYYAGPAAKDAVPLLVEMMSANGNKGFVGDCVAKTLGAIGPAAKDAIPYLIERLGRWDGSNAPYALSRIGPDAVLDLIKATMSEDLKIQSAAVLALRRMGLVARDATPALIAALNSPKAKTRMDIARALGSIGPDASYAVPALLDAGNPSLVELDNQMIREGRTAIGKIGNGTLPYLEKAVTDEDSSLRMIAAGSLGDIGPEAVPLLIKALKDSDSNVRQSAACSLSHIGPGAKEAVLPLIELLKDNSSYLLRAVAGALGEIGPEAEAALPALREISQTHELSVVQGAALIAIDKITNPQKNSAPKRELSYEFQIHPFSFTELADSQFLPSLIDNLKDEDPAIRRAAAKKLHYVGPDAAAAVPALIDNLNDEDSVVRCWAGVAIADIDPSITAAIPAVVEALGADDWELSTASGHAINRFNRIPASFAQDLISAVSKAGQPPLFGVVEPLKLLGPDVHEAIPYLIQSLQDSDDSWCIKMLSVLRYYGPEAADAAPAVIECTTHVNDQIRLRAANTLGYIGPVNDQVIPALTQLLADNNVRVNYAAGFALANFGKEAVPALIESLRTIPNPKDNCVRKALELIGHDAFPFLLAALEDDDWTMRRRAATALEYMVPGVKEEFLTSLGVEESKEELLKRVKIIASGRHPLLKSKN